MPYRVPSQSHYTTVVTLPATTRKKGVVYQAGILLHIMPREIISDIHLRIIYQAMYQGPTSVI